MTIVELFAAAFLLSVVLLALLPVVTWTVRQVNGLNDRFDILLTAENIAEVLESVPLERLNDAEAAVSALRSAGVTLQTDHWHCELSREEASDRPNVQEGTPAGTDLRRVRFVLRFHFDDLRPAPPPLRFEVVRFGAAVP